MPTSGGPTSPRVLGPSSEPHKDAKCLAAEPAEAFRRSISRLIEPIPKPKTVVIYFRLCIIMIGGRDGHTQTHRLRGPQT